MNISTFVSQYLLCLGIVAPGVFLVCRRAVKPRPARFEAHLSLSGTVSRLSGLCTPYNLRMPPDLRMLYDPQPLRSIGGSVSKFHVALECRTQGQRRPLTEFTGRFRDEGSQVILEGVFHIPFRVKLQCSVFFALFIFCGVLSGYSLIVDHNNEGAGGLLISIVIAALVLFSVKFNTQDAASDWEWLASSINSALQA
jgi:hypothetical protein